MSSIICNALRLAVPCLVFRTLRSVGPNGSPQGLRDLNEQERIAELTRR
jgi:hypothetical protein